MADNENPVDPKAQDNAPKAEEQRKYYNGKYNSVEDLEKSHAELEQKLGQQGEDLNNLRKFQSEVYPIIDIVYSNDKIMSDIRQAADAKYNVPVDPKENAEDTKEDGRTVEVKPDPRVTQQEAFLRQQAIEQFKAQHGLDKLSPEDYKQVEDQLTKVMANWILPGQPVPLDRVGRLLNDAYSIVRTDKLVEDRVLELTASQRTNQQATMGAISSGTSSNDSGVELTNDEKRFAEKLGVKPEDAAKYKERYAQGIDESIIK